MHSSVLFKKNLWILCMPDFSLFLKVPEGSETVLPPIPELCVYCVGTYMLVFETVATVRTSDIRLPLLLANKTENHPH